MGPQLGSWMGGACDYRCHFVITAAIITKDKEIVITVLSQPQTSRDQSCDYLLTEQLAVGHPNGMAGERCWPTTGATPTDALVAPGSFTGAKPKEPWSAGSMTPRLCVNMTAAASLLHLAVTGQLRRRH